MGPMVELVEWNLDIFIDETRDLIEVLVEMVDKLEQIKKKHYKKGDLSE